MAASASSTPIRIPFNRVRTDGLEDEYVRQALMNGHISGDGPFTRRVNALLESTIGTPKALLTTSCTHALEMTALLLDLKPGDEVIVPSFTFVSTANAFALRGARPVFCDSRPDTLNMDEACLEGLITPRTRAIVPVHYAGVGCEMDAILALARRHEIAVIEDNAHGLFGTYRGRQLGTLGCMATQSFHETKNFSCGEGGALLINDARYTMRAEILREKGTNRSRFFRGEVDKYTWVDVGSSYLPSDMLAAFLLAQLERRDAIQSHRAAIWNRYRAALADWAAACGIGLPVVPEHCGQAFHMFYVMMPDLATRTAFITHMKSAGILCVFHYQPLHASAMGEAFGCAAADCPVAASAGDRLVRLPFYNSLDESQQSLVIEEALRFTL